MSGAPRLRLPFRLGELRSERLLVRPLRMTDADDVAVYQGVPEVVRYLPWPVRDRMESHRHTAMRSGMTGLEREGDACFAAIEARTGPHAGRVVGDLTLVATSVRHAQVEVGWVLAPDATGRGIATEAAALLVDECFGRLGAHRVRARLDVRNEASAAVCARLGMRHEGVFREDEYAKDEWTDTSVWAVLASEWRAPRGDSFSVDDTDGS